MRWQHLPSTPTVPTAPVAAGNLVFLAGSDGAVRAFDAATGQPRWKAYTASSVFFPPAIAQGRAYVGSNDGFVYALEAATGSPLWRFRAAPSQRTIPVYGEIASTWPVAGGALADNGVLYAAAGISHFDGTHVYALDAATGQIKWHNDSSGSLDPKVTNGVSLCGPLKLDGNQLSFPGGNVYPTASYDIQTGQCLNKPAGPHASRRIFLFPRKLWEPIDADDRNTSRGPIRLRAARNARSYTLALFPDNSDKPAWSTTLYAYLGCAVSPNAFLMLARTSETENGLPSPYRLVALSLLDGSTLFSHPLPAAPVHWGLAVDAQSRIFVSLEDGRLLSFAAK